MGLGAVLGGPLGEAAAAGLEGVMGASEAADAAAEATDAAVAAAPVRVKNNKNRNGPIQSSTLFPKSHKNQRLPTRWNQLA